MQSASPERLAKVYIRFLKVRNLSERTIREQQRKLDRFFVFLRKLGIERMDQVNSAIILDYQTHLYHAVNRQGRPNSPGYQNSMLAVVKGFTKFLKQRDFLVADPAADVRYARVPQMLPRGILTRSEARRIINAPDVFCTIGYRDRTILEVLYTTGIRKEELNNLTLNDVDYNDGFLRIIQGKGKKDRMVPLGRICCRYLENYIKSVRPELITDPYNNHLFLTFRGNRLSKNVVWELVKKYAKQAGIKKNVSPHTFRHTCATAMLKNKADIRAVQELLGHASLDSTQVYTRVTINDLKEVHARCHPRERDRE
jgi:integrase/recombinase XerD